MGMATPPTDIQHVATVFKSVDWLVPAYLSIGGIRQLASESDSNRLGNAISVMLCMGHQTLAKRRDMSLTLAT
jgi:hypothetical protein